MILDWLPSVDAIFKITMASNYLHASLQIIRSNLCISMCYMSYIIC